MKIYEDVSNEMKEYPYKTITYRNVDISSLKNILKEERFVF